MKVSELMSNNVEWMKKNEQTWSIFYNMKEWGAKGDGVDDDRYTLDKIIQDLDGRDGVIIFPKGDYRIGTNYVIPEHVYLYFVGEGFLVPDSGVTLTINGGIIAGPYQIFKGEGNANGSKVIVDQFYPEWWGAKGDGITDDTVAITKTVDMASNSTILFFNKTYLVTNATLLNPLNSTVYKAEGTLSRFLYNGQYYPIPLGTALFSNGDNKVTVSIGGNVKTIELTGNDLLAMRDEFSTFDARLDTLIQGGGPDKDLELVDIRTPVTGYVPGDTIHAAGDMTRDMQRQIVSKASVETVNKLQSVTKNIDNPLVGNTRIIQEDDAYNAWASLIKDSNNKLFCMYNKGVSHTNESGSVYVVGRKVVFKYSLDMGVTWSEEIDIISDPAKSYMAHGIIKLSNGTMIVCVEEFFESTPSKSYIMKSTDDGLTWTKIFDFEQSSDAAIAARGNCNMFIELAPGTVMSFKHVVYGVGQYGISAIFSYDYGNTWNTSTVVVPATNSGYSHIPWEIRGEVVGPNKIIAMGRNDIGNLYQITSADNGLTWSVELTNISDARIVCVDLIHFPEDDALALYYADRGSNTLKKRVVSASLIFTNPTAWSNAEIIMYTGSSSVSADFGYVTVVRSLSSKREVMGVTYTTRETNVPNGTPKNCAIVLFYDVVPGRLTFETLFRDVNTATPKSLALYKGDGTNTIVFRIQDGVITIINSLGVTITAGNGSPEGVVTANNGSLYLRRNGAANTTLYIKETGSGNTGWVAK